MHGVSWFTYSTTVVSSALTGITSLFLGAGARMWININAIQFQGQTMLWAEKQSDYAHNFYTS